MNFETFNKSGSAFASLEIKLNEIELSKTCEELSKVDDVFRVVSIMFSKKGEYGKSAFLVCADDADQLFTLWLPKHMLKVCEEMVESQEAVDAILSGKCGIRGEAYTDKKGVERYAIRWCNI